MDNRFQGWRFLTTIVTFQMMALTALAAGAPVAPSNLVGSALSSSQVQLSWKDNSSNELGFVIQRSLDSVNFTNLVSVAANAVSFKDSDLAANKKYYYRIGAYNKSGNGSSYHYSYSNIVGVTTLDTVSTGSWVRCASQGSVCSFSGTHDVRYGTSGYYITKTAVTGSIECTNSAFGGDPIPNYGKYCDYYSSTSSSPVTTTSTTTTTTTTTTITSVTTTTMPPTTTTTLQPPPPTSISGSLTDIQVQSLSTSSQSNVPVTFGQVFIQGQLFPTESLVGVTSSGSQIPLQVNVKATHSDGSVRHAIISAIVPQLLAGQTQAIGLVKTAGVANPSSNATDLVNAGFSALATLNVGGVTYTASANQAISAGTAKSWLNGSIANEWTLVVPLKDASGNAHPHLVARYAARYYPTVKKAKVDVVIENGWAYQAGPQNFTYDVQINIGGQVVYSKSALTHYHHARWKKTFWWGAEPQIHLRHNTKYLISTKAVPNYDQTIPVSDSKLNDFNARLVGAAIEPMGNGLVTAYMPTTGGRPDIGLEPGWVAMYILSMDQRAKKASLISSDAAGSWSTHYRDQNTDRPVSIKDYPYLTIIGRMSDTLNPATGKYEGLPACGGDCTTPYTADSAHQPNLSYVPYLLTGDFYYLEELQFWAMFNVAQPIGAYRDFSTGLVKWDQLRGQAWTLRTLANAAYISPDTDALKSQLTTFLNNNLNWYNNKYSNNVSANALGIIEEDFSYYSGTGIAPWQDDFFTQAVGHASELGFANALPLLKWKAKFPVGRMTAPGYCWIYGSIYSLVVRDSATSPVYSSFDQVYQAVQPSRTPDSVKTLTCASAEMATALNLKQGEMVGYSNSYDGMPSDLQPALAYSVDAGALNAATAWQVFMSRTVKPDYQNGPEFSIVPRK